RECNLFIFAPFHLVTPVERVDVLLSIADERELVNVCFRGQPGKHLLALSFSGFDPFETSDVPEYTSLDRPQRLPSANLDGYAAASLRLHTSARRRLP